MIQGKTVVEDVIMTKAKGVETKRGDSKIPDKKDLIKLIKRLTRNLHCPEFN